MRWLEIINVRTSGRAEFTKALRSCCHVQESTGPDGPAGIHLYRHTVYETDLSIRLCWDSVAAEPGRTRLGIHLSESLASFGMLDHFSWQPVQMDETGGVP